MIGRAAALAKRDNGGFRGYNLALVNSKSR